MERLDYKMIQEIKRILGSEYIVDEEKEIVEVHHLTNSQVDQETYIKIKNNMNDWTLYEVQRGESYEVCEFNNYDAFIYGLYILSKKIFEHPKGNPMIKSELRQCSEADTDNVIKIIAKESHENLFSLNKLKKGAIIIEKVNDYYDVSYCGLNEERINIVNGRKFSNAVVVFYNYIVIVNEFEKIIKSIALASKLSKEEVEKLKRCYLGK